MLLPACTQAPQTLTFHPTCGSGQGWGPPRSRARTSRGTRPLRGGPPRPPRRAPPRQRDDTAPGRAGHAGRTAPTDDVTAAAGARPTRACVRARAAARLRFPGGRAARPLPARGGGPGSGGGSANPAATGRRLQHAGRPAAGGGRRVGYPAPARSCSRVSGGRCLARAPGGRREAKRAERAARPAGGRRRHVERPQLVHQPGGGRVRGVRGAHLLGHVRHRVHAPVPRRRALHPALPGAEAQAAGACPGRGRPSPGLRPPAPQPEDPAAWRPGRSAGRPASVSPARLAQQLRALASCAFAPLQPSRRLRSPVPGGSSAPRGASPDPCPPRRPPARPPWCGRADFLTPFAAERVHHHALQPRRREQRGSRLERGGLRRGVQI